MLTQETKRKIDTGRDILVGKVPDPKAQVEQITTALIYKFMDDMDKEAQELGGKARFFSKGYEKYSWSKLVDSRLGGMDRLNLYVEAITSLSRNPNLPQLFRDIFKDAFLPFRDPETLNLFLKEINGFTYEHSEDLGDAFEYLLSVLGSQGEAGQFRTPRHIIDFIVAAIDPKKDEKVCDPACGTAGFLISAYKHILKQHDGLNDPEHIEKSLTPDERKQLMNHFSGYDISPDMVRLSKVNLYLHGFPNPTIYEYDTLTSEDKWDESFDVMLANPPFMSPKGGIKPHKRFSVQAKRSEVLFVDYILEHLMPNGRAGIIVPEGVLFKSETAYKQLRRLLIEDGLFTVISLPQGVFNPYSGVKTGIFLFDKEFAKKTDSLMFVKVQNDGFDLGAQRREIEKNDLPAALELIKRYKSSIINREKFILNENDKKLVHIVSKEKISENGEYNLTGEKYRESLNSIHQKWPLVELGELLDYEQPTKYIVSSIDYDDSYKTPVLTPGKSFILGYTNEENGVFKDELPVIIFDDFTTATKYVDFPFKVKSSAMKILHANKNRIDIKYAFNLMQKIQFSSSTHKRYWISEYSKIKIPLPPLEVQVEIVKQVEARQQVIKAVQELIYRIGVEKKYFTQSLANLDSVRWVELGDVVNFVRGPFGGSLKKEIFKASGYLVYEQNHAINDDFNFGRYFIDENKFTEMKRFEVFAGDLLISCSGTMGKVAIVPENYKKGIINQALLKLTPNKDQIIGKYLKLLLEADFIQEKYFKDQSGSSIQNVASVRTLKGIEIPLPSIETQTAIVSEIDKQEKLIDENRKLIKTMEKKIDQILEEI